VHRAEISHLHAILTVCHSVQLRLAIQLFAYAELRIERHRVLRPPECARGSPLVMLDSKMMPKAGIEQRQTSRPPRRTGQANGNPYVPCMVRAVGIMISVGNRGVPTFLEGRFGIDRLPARSPAVLRHRDRCRARSAACPGRRDHRLGDIESRLLLKLGVRGLPRRSRR